MKNLETLIQELCPDGVEFRTMEEVFEIRNGYTPSKNNPDFWEGGTIPWFRMEDIRQNGRILSDAIQHITPAAIKGKGLFPANSIIIATTATIGEHALVIADSLANQQFTNLTVRKSLSACLLPKFVFYYMFVIDEWCKKNVNAGNFASVDMKRFKKLDFPLPPIEVQTEIIHILDKFTSLEVELEMDLEVELDCRKRQYEYYRDKLLSFDNVEGQEVEWKKMSEVSFYPKTRIDASELSDNSYIGVENLLKDKLGRTDSTVKPEGSVIQFVEKDILIGNIRPYLRKIWKSDCKGGTNGDVLCIRVKVPSEVSADYLFHILSSEKFFLYDIKNSKGAKMPRGDKSAVMDFEIPIPSLEEQHRIVSILDRFESLTTSLQTGLPAEITARRQQYEHYRGKLLTFKRKGAA